MFERKTILRERSWQCKRVGTLLDSAAKMIEKSEKELRSTEINQDEASKRYENAGSGEDLCTNKEGLAPFKINGVEALRMFLLLQLSSIFVAN